MLELLKERLSIETYNEYINFIEDKKTVKQKGKTELHHILPSSTYPQFSNLRNNVWNGVHLLYKDHLYAHYILAKDDDEFSVMFFLGKINRKYNDTYFDNYQNIKERAIKVISNKVSIWRNNLTEDEKKILNDKNSKSVKKFFSEQDSSFFEKKTKAWENTVNQKSLSEIKIWREKIIETRKKNNSYVSGGIKAVKTMRETICENGYSIKENASIKMKQTRIKDNSFITGAKKSSETKRNTLNEEGKNIYQVAYEKGLMKKDAKEIAIKAAKTMRETICENGLSINENRLNKRNAKMKEIGDDGLTGYQRARLKQDRRIFYSVKIFDNNENELEFYEKIQKKELEQNSKYPITLLWNGEKFNISKNTRIYNKKFEGYYLVKQGIKK